MRNRTGVNPKLESAFLFGSDFSVHEYQLPEMDERHEWIRILLNRLEIRSFREKPGFG